VAFANALPVLYGLSAAATWGAADFAGGVAAKRANEFKVVLVAHASSLIFVAAMALISREAIPPLSAHVWGAISGIAGGAGVACLYRALAIGKMGTVAPVTGLLTAALPVIVGGIQQGRPRILQICGFCLALAAIVLIAKPDEFHGKPKGVGLAVIAGLCFGLFIVFLRQAGTVSIFWPLVSSRIASTALMILIVLTLRSAGKEDSAAWPFVTAIVCGVLDSIGNLMLVLATRSGRLDVAAVLSSLYPAATVILAFIILKERVSRIQNVGIVAALAAVPMIAG
jgi:drug/metabolite transporter (DMT)-like permease